MKNWKNHRIPSNFLLTSFEVTDILLICLGSSKVERRPEEPCDAGASPARGTNFARDVKSQRNPHKVLGVGAGPTIGTNLRVDNLSM